MTWHKLPEPDPGFGNVLHSSSMYLFSCFICWMQTSNFLKQSPTTECSVCITSVPDSILEGHCTECFRCFRADTNEWITIRFSSRSAQVC